MENCFLAFDSIIEDKVVLQHYYERPDGCRNLKEFRHKVYDEPFVLSDLAKESYPFGCDDVSYFTTHSSFEDAGVLLKGYGYGKEQELPNLLLNRNDVLSPDKDEYKLYYVHRAYSADRITAKEIADVEKLIETNNLKIKDKYVKPFQEVKKAVNYLENLQNKSSCYRRACEQISWWKGKYPTYRDIAFELLKQGMSKSQAVKCIYKNMDKKSYPVALSAVVRAMKTPEIKQKLNFSERGR